MTQMAVYLGLDGDSFRFRLQDLPSALDLTGFQDYRNDSPDSVWNLCQYLLTNMADYETHKQLHPDSIEPEIWSPAWVLKQVSHSQVQLTLLSHD